MPFDIDEPEEDPPVPLDDLSMNTAPAPLRVPGFAAIPGVDHRPPGFAPLRLATSQTNEPRAPVPLSAVRARAIYAPEPERERLAATRAGRFNQRPGDNETTFCVDATGHTTDIRTVRPFPGDPDVDAVIRATIATWRFEPFMLAGATIKTCTSQEFRISFE